MPLCPVLDPRIGLLSPTSCLLTLLGGVRIEGKVRDKGPIGVMQSVSPYSLRPPGGVRSGGAACRPLALVRGTGDRKRDSRGHISRLGASHWYTRDVAPLVGVPAAGLADRHTTLIKGRQSSQHR